MALPIDVSQPSRFPRASGADGLPSSWALAFVIFQIFCQLALLSPTIGPFRVFVRTAVFGASLVLLAALPGRGRLHPAAHPVLAVWAILGLSLFHPTTNLLAGIAQVAMYVAVSAPLFWVPRLKIDTAVLRRILTILWVFHTASAGLGILQVSFPGRFQPNLSSAMAAQGQGYINSLQITTASGQRVFRPMGLTDAPGGAAMPAFYSVLFGMGFFLTSRHRLLRVGCVGSMIVGMECLCLSQVRSVLVMLGLCMTALCVLLARRGEMKKLAVLATASALAVALGFTWAVSVGGETISRRLASLVEDRPDEVYYKHRGFFLEYTIEELLPRYPLGAGLGRWGMMNAYFGDHSDPERASIGSEIQWTGWLLDGGLPLIAAYLSALALALRTAWRAASGQHAGDLWLWAALVLAYDLGAVALTFTYPLFIGQGGLEFWLLNAVLFAASRSAHRPPRSFQRARR